MNDSLRPGPVFATNLTGTTKWFDGNKGYGFITPDAPLPRFGQKDVFVHFTALAQDGYKTLNEGSKVIFDLAATQGSGYPTAVNVRFAPTKDATAAVALLSPAG